MDWIPDWAGEVIALAIGGIIAIFWTPIKRYRKKVDELYTLHEQKTGEVAKEYEAKIAQLEEEKKRTLEKVEEREKAEFEEIKYMLKKILPVVDKVENMEKKQVQLEQRQEQLDKRVEEMETIKSNMLQVIQESNKTLEKLMNNQKKTV